MPHRKQEELIIFTRYFQYCDWSIQYRDFATNHRTESTVYRPITVLKIPREND